MNFKKHISVFLALFLLFVNSSASLVLHYCHDQIAYVALVYQENKVVNSASADSCCATDELQDDGSCCTNEEFKADKKLDYSILKGFQFNFEAVCFQNKLVPLFNEFKLLSKNKKTLEYYCNSNAPPFYKLYSQLIFYA